MRRMAVALVAAFLLAGTAGAEPAVTLTGELSASLAGLPVAAGEFTATLANGRYQVSGSGRTAGLSRLVSSGRARVESSGRIAQGALTPASYRHELVDRDDRGSVRIAFDGDRVSSVSVHPPPRPRRDRVPLGEEHVRRVLDPVSAVMLLSAAPPGPDLCNRTLPIFDGAARYDIELSYKRTDSFHGPHDSYSGPAYVCAVRYRPIAGHRPGRSAVKYLQSADGMEVWMAPVAEGVVAPVRARVPTPYGPLVLSATRLALQ